MASMMVRTSKHLWNVGAAIALMLAGCGDDQPITSATDGGSSGGGSTTTPVTGSTGPGTTTGTPTTTDPTSGSGGMSDTVATTSGPTTDPTATTGGTTMDVTATGTTAMSTTGTTSGGSSSGGSTGMVCPADTLVCDGNTKQVCDGMGGFKDVEMCPNLCLEPFGCVACMPGTTQCNGNVAQKCSDDGMMWQDVESCDALQGVMCDPMAGQCAGACSAANLGTSYIGCDYYPATLANLHETQPWNFYYAVVVANTTNQMATITVTKGANQVTQTSIGPNTAKVIQLPYVNELVKPTINEAGPSLVVVDGSYRLRSNQPVTVYQYEPLDYKSGNLFSYTNDASLLLPVNTWSGNYVVASRNHWVISGFNLPGFYAVVARFDNTKVTLAPSATGKIVNAGGGVAANGSGVVMLNEGDVLEVFTASGGGVPDASDLTGTIINADKPVEVFGGHKCTQVPVGTQACDRLEEAMLPIETLAKKYIVTPPLIPTGGMVPKAQMVRVIATEDATTIMYDPPQAAPTMLAKAGDYFEIAKTVADFEIQSDKKILVSQYMQGQAAGGNSGDPAMALAVATEQYRSKYLVHAPINYESNYANITAPMGSTIMLDGVAVAGFTAIGATGFGVARVKIANNVDGNHTLTGDKPFGVSIYGYGQYTSYWYPGGLDLEVLPQ